MGTLLVVRHGQASFGSPDYDQLSPLGEAQSVRLGESLARRTLAIDAVYVGPARRHEQTCRAIRAGALAAGTALPEALPCAGLAEFPAFLLVAKHRQTHGDTPATFEEICHAWLAGELDHGDLVSAVDFELRVHETLRHVCAEQGTGKTVLLVTSGGPTAMAVKRALDLSVEKAAEVLWVVANSSLSSFKYRDTSYALHSFNSTAHLDPKDITYR